MKKTQINAREKINERDKSKFFDYIIGSNNINPPSEIGKKPFNVISKVTSRLPQSAISYHHLLAERNSYAQNAEKLSHEEYAY